MFHQQHITKLQDPIEKWFEDAWQVRNPPIYSSVDLRPSAFKCSPVDLNLYPGGFNNIQHHNQKILASALRESILQVAPNARRIALTPENHTRNLFYLENILHLASALTEGGFETRIGRLANDFDTNLRVLNLPTASGKFLEQHFISRDNDRLVFHDGWVPDFILNNNDLSSGIPDLLQNIKQPVLPPNKAGWMRRRKSLYFNAFEKVVHSFSSAHDIDPWSLNPEFRSVKGINFHEKVGEEELVHHVAEILHITQKEYQKRHIDRKPFVIIKADAGTYGMGIMTARTPNDVRDLNRKQRNKMNSVKEGLIVSEVLIQEGVYSDVHVGSHLAEPVVYMANKDIVGSFYRANSERSPDENLNAQGMYFSPLAFEHHTAPEFYLYSVVARLSLLAAADELELMS